MKLKNMIQIGSFVVAGALPTTSKAQVYMCQACPAGTYSDGTQTQCTPCPAGTYSNGGAGSCTKCKPGTYSTGGAGQCSPCPIGQYNNTEGATSCQKCSGGTYAGGTGNTSCSRCPDYHWSSAGAGSCGRIQLRFYYWVWSKDWSSQKFSKWFNAGDTMSCNNETFGDPLYGEKKHCGSDSWHIVHEDTSIPLNCPTLPCRITGNNRGEGESEMRHLDFTAGSKDVRW